MNRYGIVLLAGLFFALGMSRANAKIVTFDDLVISGVYAQISDGYAGLIWDNMRVMNPSSLPSGVTGYPNGLVSPSCLAFNWEGNAGAITGVDGDFDFKGAYFTSAFRDGLSIDVVGLKSGSLVYSRTITVDTTSPTWFDFDYQGIDSLSLASYGGVTHPGYYDGAQFTMDNFTFDDTVVTPEPVSTVLFGLGGMAMAYAHRRRNFVV